MVIDIDDLVAMRIGDRVICLKCAPNEYGAGDAQYELDNMVLRDEVWGYDNLWFCDRCRRRIV
jgi:hypothetical protein